MNRHAHASRRLQARKGRKSVCSVTTRPCSARVLNLGCTEEDIWVAGAAAVAPLQRAGSQIYRNPWDVLTHFAHYLHARAPLTRASVSRVPLPRRATRTRWRNGTRAARVVARGARDADRTASSRSAIIYLLINRAISRIARSTTFLFRKRTRFPVRL